MNLKWCRVAVVCPNVLPPWGRACPNYPRGQTRHQNPHLCPVVGQAHCSSLTWFKSRWKDYLDKRCGWYSCTIKGSRRTLILPVGDTLKVDAFGPPESPSCVSEGYFQFITMRSGQQRCGVLVLLALLVTGEIFNSGFLAHANLPKRFQSVKSGRNRNVVVFTINLTWIWRNCLQRVSAPGSLEVKWSPASPSSTRCPCSLHEDTTAGPR